MKWRVTVFVNHAHSAFEVTILQSQTSICNYTILASSPQSLAPHHADVDDINSNILEPPPGSAWKLKSTDASASVRGKCFQRAAGQTLKCADTYLRKDCLSYEQFHVACSGVGNPKFLRIYQLAAGLNNQAHLLLESKMWFKSKHWCTKNLSLICTLCIYTYKLADTCNLTPCMFHFVCIPLVVPPTGRVAAP
eukprot:6207590-Pleurochrysis_carterae.AAC.3